MATYRATRNEPRIGVGEWTGDFFRDKLYESSSPNNEGAYPRGKNLVPDYLCDYLVSHGILEDVSKSKGPAEAPAPPVSPQPPSISVLPIQQVDSVQIFPVDERNSDAGE